MMDSLLSPQESHSFHSFLSALGDGTQWSLAPDIPKDKQALAKATKDLMALDHPYCPADILYPYNYTLPPPPNSDSSSRTPTPTSTEPYPPQQPARARPSHPHPYPASQRRSQSFAPSPHSAPLLPPQPPAPQPPRIKPPQAHTKPALLSPSQKKANHIQSEQKRRANIRRGYEALCESVPALREAIRLEEEAAVGLDSSKSGFTQGKGKKPRTASRPAKDGEDKVDGRAGPRSENVVLSKTIDYITELLDERRSLLERLHRARITLPPGHPALVPPLDHNEDGPLWEREWKGGQGSLGPDDEGDGSS